MKKLLFQSGVLVLLLALMPTGHAQDSRYIPVFCGVGHSLQDALDRATEGASLDVYGTCNEAVVIRTDRVRIGTFFGQETFINPPDESIAFTVLADHVEIFRFNITGGAVGVRIAQGSSARVINNDIRDSTGVGIVLDSGSYGLITDNVLQSTSGNFSQIFVAGGSSADVINNTITASSGSGISVEESSHMQVSGNTVSGTVFHGIGVQHNSHMWFSNPNTVNTILCSPSGSLRVDVEQTITGGAGAVNLATGCDLIKPAAVIFPPP